jgi:septal ring factor EnvC (AmiA/AmiB activator)
LQVLQELGADSQLERFRLEYETLYRALKKSHESEKRLVKKCRELVTDITGTKNKTENAVKLSAEDQTMIAQLRTDIVRTSTAVETSLLKEKDTKEELEQLRIEIEELRQEVKAAKSAVGAEAAAAPRLGGTPAGGGSTRPRFQQSTVAPRLYRLCGA